MPGNYAVHGLRYLSRDRCIIGYYEGHVNKQLTAVGSVSALHNPAAYRADRYYTYVKPVLTESPFKNAWISLVLKGIDMRISGYLHFNLLKLIQLCIYEVSVNRLNQLITPLADSSFAQPADEAFLLE